MQEITQTVKTFTQDEIKTMLCACTKTDQDSTTIKVVPYAGDNVEQRFVVQLITTKGASNE